MHNHVLSGNNDSSRRIGWAFFLNVGFTIIEFIGGWLTNSTAIMSDAVHDLGDRQMATAHLFLIFTKGYG